MVVSFTAHLFAYKHFGITVAMQGGCVGVIYITVKLKKHKITAAQRWSFYTGGY